MDKLSDEDFKRLIPLYVKYAVNTNNTLEFYRKQLCSDLKKLERLIDEYSKPKSL